MARLVINSTDLSEKLHSFSLRCDKCESARVTLDIDWASYPSASWLKIDIICDDCKHDEEVFSTS